MVVTAREAVPVEAKALEQEHVGCDERVHPSVSPARADHKGLKLLNRSDFGAFQKDSKDLIADLLPRSPLAGSFREAGWDPPAPIP